MTMWKRISQTEYTANGEMHGVTVPVPNGHRMRVTVEEEVNECCEKWRGRYACLMRNWEVEGGADCVFCPECGRKL